MKYAWLNKIYIAKKATQIVSGIYAILGFIGILIPINTSIESLLPQWQAMSIQLKLCTSASILIGVWLVLILLVSAWVYHQKYIEILKVNGGKRVVVSYGDILENNIVFSPERRRNTVIPVNRCFDTIVNDILVSRNTIHGRKFTKLYESGYYNEVSLKEAINNALENVSPETLTDNRKRYPLGTVIDLPTNPTGNPNDEHMFLWALSKFDENMHANTTKEEFVIAVQRLIEACGEMSEGYPVVIPLVGTGLSRTNIHESDVLSYLISSFKCNRNCIRSDIHIVVYKDRRNDILFSRYPDV